MKITIPLKSEKKLEFANAGIQKKNDGRSTAVYDAATFRILAEYKVNQISMCQSSSEDAPKNRVMQA